MNSREISELFTNPNEQDFNPIQTFGNRQSSSSLSNNKNINKSDNFRTLHERDRDRQAREQYKQETRIKLLTSYQQSYLESVSQPMFTEQDQPSEIRANDRTNQLTYSESKRSGNKYDRYLNTDSMLDDINQNKMVQIQSKLGKTEANRNQKFVDINHQQERNQRLGINNQDQAVIQARKKQATKDKIKVLSIAIEEEQYQLSVQQRLYNFLITRLDDRNRTRKLRDSQQLVQRAIDFMDSGDQFMKQLIKLSKMQQT